MDKFRIGIAAWTLPKVSPSQVTASAVTPYLHAPVIMGHHLADGMRSCRRAVIHKGALLLCHEIRAQGAPKSAPKSSISDSQAWSKGFRAIHPNHSFVRINFLRECSQHAALESERYESGQATAASSPPEAEDLQGLAGGSPCSNTFPNF